MGYPYTEREVAPPGHAAVNDLKVGGKGIVSKAWHSERSENTYLCKQSSQLKVSRAQGAVS